MNTAEDTLLEGGLAETIDEAITTPLDVNKGVVEQFFAELPDKAFRFGIKVALALLLFLIGSCIIHGFRKVIKKAMKKANADISLLKFVDSFIKTILYLLLLLLILSLFGLQASSIAALIATVGVAISLGLQGSLNHLIGGMLLLFTHPFKTGDYIEVQGMPYAGTVLQMDLFYTRLRTMDNKLVLVPNGTLAGAGIVNTTALKYRMINIPVSISYEAEIDRAKLCMMQVMEQNKYVIQDMDKKVFVDELADSGVKMQFTCYVESTDFLTAKREMIEEVKKSLDDNRVEIPFPQVTVHMKNS